MNNLLHNGKTHTPPLYLLLSLTCFLLAMLLHMSQIRTINETIASHLAPYVLRFHILANSDTAEDQEIKLEIRSLVLDYLNQNLDAEAGKQETSDWMIEHRTEIEQLADMHLNKHGFDYNARLELTKCYFPTRFYDGFTFPCGTYDAARITLGNGQGHNWWCVLYPRFCFVDSTYTTDADSTAGQAISPASAVSSTATAHSPSAGRDQIQQLFQYASHKTQQSGASLPEEHRPTVKYSIKFLSLFTKTNDSK